MADPGEPSLKQEDFLAFLKGYTPEAHRRGERDMLAGRWRILMTQPLPELSSSYARAYVARDDKTPDASLYALVFEDGVPLRQKNIHFLKTYRHPSLIPLLAEGLAEIGADFDSRYVAILEKPAGQPLAQLLARRGETMPETTILQQYLRPLAEILVAFNKHGISHNRIHPGNIYLVGGKAVLGECISEPSGFSQDPVFEPVERMLTLPRAKTEFAPGADYYALAMLALHLAVGYAPFANVRKEALIRDILANGSYHALIVPWDVPTGLQDFFRGVMTDGKRDRWDMQTIESWLSGRRFNLVMPASARETARGFEFAGNVYLNRRSLANGLWQNWKEALKMLPDNRLGRWLNTHAHKHDTADAVTKITQTGSPMTLQQEEEALARVIMVLDPTGPLRFRQISVSAEGVGALLAHAFIAERNDDVQTLTHLIDADLPGFWMEQQKSTPEYVAIAAKLQKARNHMRMKGLGFGLERCLYDLNPGLPCLSPMLKGHHVSTLAELLAALDAVSAKSAATEDVGDRHIAAFIASRIDQGKELQIAEMQSLPGLKTNSTLIMLKLLEKAQRKAGERVFKGLTHWFALKMLPMLGDLHSRARRSKLKIDLRAAAGKGSLDEMASLIFTRAAFESDRKEFQKAAADYAARKKQIASLQGAAGLARDADIKGQGVAQSIAFGICIATVYVSLKAYFHL